MKVASAKAGRSPLGSGVLHDPVGDRLGIAEAVGMVGRAVLDHHGDPAAELVVAILDGQRMPLEQEILAAADVQQRNVVPGQLPELREVARPDRGIVGVDARDLVGMGRGPLVGVDAALAHADERRLPREAVLLGEVGVPGVPLLAGVGRDEGNVEAPPEQLDLGLGLVVPVTASPEPGIAGRRLLRDDDDATPLALLRGLDPVAFGLGPLEGGDGQAFFVHHEVVSVEAVVPGGLLALEGGVTVRRMNDQRSPQDRRDQKRCDSESCLSAYASSKSTESLHGYLP